MPRAPQKIVPVFRPEPLVKPAAPPRLTAKLTFRGGPLLTQVEVITLFWGSGWQLPPASALIEPTNAFFDFILVSPLMDQLSEYNTANFEIGTGKRIATFNRPNAPLAGSVTDETLRSLLQREIQNTEGFPQPSLHRLYFNFLPPGVALVQAGDRSCQNFCGYHDAVGDSLFYAAMPFPDCAGCQGGLSLFDSLTAITPTRMLFATISFRKSGRLASM